MLRIKVLILFCLFSLSCGIKGKPSPPLDPPWIGNGEVRRDFNKNRKNEQPEVQNTDGTKVEPSGTTPASSSVSESDSLEKDQKKTKKKKND